MIVVPDYLLWTGYELGTSTMPTLIFISNFHVGCLVLCSEC